MVWCRTKTQKQKTKKNFKEQNYISIKLCNVQCNEKTEKNGAEWKQNVSGNSVANTGDNKRNENKKNKQNQKNIATGKQCEATIEIRKETETKIRNQ